MRVCPLASGSSGNATWIEGADGAVLIDAGLPAAQLMGIITSAGLRRERLKGVFLTHEHADHWRGADGLGKELGIPLFLTAGTYRALEGRLGKMVKTEILQRGVPVIVGGLSVHPHAVIHDAREPVCYSIAEGDSCAAVVTDLGVPDEETARVLERAQILLFEANYDPRMLAEGPYPRHLKNRISSGKGHLSNAIAAEFLARHLGTQCRLLVLSHLSEVNNTPEIALRCVRDALKDRIQGGLGVMVAERHASSGILDGGFLGKGPARQHGHPLEVSGSTAQGCPAAASFQKTA